jgi:hypothetical protein
MPAFIRKGSVHRQAWFGVDAWFGGGGLKNGQEQILGLRMGYCAGGFALLAANATFRIYKDSFHPQFLSRSRVKGTEIEALCFQNTSSLETLFPHFLGKQLCKPGNRLSYYRKDSLAIQLTKVTFLLNYPLPLSTQNGLVWNFVGSLYVFLLYFLTLDVAMIILKGGYVPVCLLGEDIDASLFQAFLTAFETKSCSSERWR